MVHAYKSEPIYEFWEVRTAHTGRFSAPVVVILIKRDVFLKLGGFGPTYFSYFEDVDLCWRAIMFGLKIISRSVILQ